MKKLNSIIAVCMTALLCGCGGGAGTGNSVKTGDGPLSPLAEKYVQIGLNNQELSEMRDQAEDPGSEKISKFAIEVRQKNDALEEEAKAAAEELKGKTIPCEASEGTGLTNPVCTISAVRASSSNAAVVLVFKAEQEITNNFGCLFENSKGEIIEKLRLYVSGDGTPQVIYMFSPKRGALQATDLTKIRLVTVEEFEGSTVSTNE